MSFKESELSPSADPLFVYFHLFHPLTTRECALNDHYSTQYLKIVCSHGSFRSTPIPDELQMSSRCALQWATLVGLRQEQTTTTTTTTAATIWSQKPDLYAFL